MFAHKDIAGIEQKNIVIFSGGTGCRAFAKTLKEIAHNVSYILPISDNGGSTGEIMRWFGGPSIGDIRSRLSDLRNDSSIEGERVSKLLSHRINPANKHNESCIKEWLDFVRGRHKLYAGISDARKYLITRELRFMNELIFREAPEFNFRNASIGNLFLSGIRMATNSLESAILLYSDMADIQEKIIPVINTNKTLTIAAELADGKVIYGQNEISHPATDTFVKKETNNYLTSHISRIFYTDQVNNKVLDPIVNPTALSALENADIIIFSMGSFWTSLMPMLILPKIGQAITAQSSPKLMILNGSRDRETSGMTAKTMISTLTQTINRSAGNDIVDGILSDVIYLENGDFQIIPEELSGHNINTRKSPQEKGSLLKHYDSKELVDAIIKLSK